MATAARGGESDGGEGAIVVVGAGTMGHGIAQVFAMAGFAVTLTDATEALARRGVERIRLNLEEAVRRGKLDAAAVAGPMGRIRAGGGVADAAPDADIIIEAVPERQDLKRSVLEAAESAAPDDALLATNTSSLSIGGMQAWLRRPERFLGLHFFNPVHINRLLEVVKGPRTDPATLERALAVARRIGKEPVVVNDSPGFATSRLGVLLGLEAMRMLEAGVASAADIDTAMELGYRHPMGPLRLTDLVGLDVRLDIARYLHAELGTECFRPPAILERMVAEGRLGRKTGRGFYDWSEEEA
jgi:3-hydroxybutyryl-CoA dehydrogenase